MSQNSVGPYARCHDCSDSAAYITLTRMVMPRVQMCSFRTDQHAAMAKARL